MSATSGDQLELLAPAPDQQGPSDVNLLGLVLDQTAFLQFLSSEWLVPSTGKILLGIKQACGSASAASSSVAVWFDAHILPDYTVMVWRDGRWAETTLREVQTTDSLVSWSGPLPAFAVDHFSVSSDAARTKLLALARNFADMEAPSQPFEVGSISQVEPPLEAPPGRSPWQPPQHWDALRGAAALAAFAVPAIDPWVDLLCDVLRSGVSMADSAERLNAPWWRAALWSNPEEQEELPALWRAMVAEFSKRGRLNEWRARGILQDICERARHLGEDQERLAALEARTKSLLDDRGTIEELGSHDDFLALTLQLLLLRPSPERFLGWRDDWPAIPPAAWWTGMTLAGYLQGYQSLPMSFRGTPESRRLLALKTWQHASASGSGPWNNVTPDIVTWRVDGGSIVMMADGRPWAEHKLGTRGSWYRADFRNSSVQVEAKELALDACPEAVDQVVAIEDASVQLLGTGTIKSNAKQSVLTVTGRLELPLGPGVTLERRLNLPRFKHWLATASITRRLGRPSVVSTKDEGHPPAGEVAQTRATKAKDSAKKPAAKRATRASAATVATDAPFGLTVLPEFITDDEEALLVATIDALEWDRSMKRRVQHHGWQYDYKARRVSPDSYIGPLPDWAHRLAERLLARGVVPELPDQVIVNNYDGKQGITRHIDCKDCFLGPVVTISLLETWDMVFTRRIGEQTLRYEQALPRRSAAVLDGEARSVWQHEIPERLREHGVPRRRRISITFRKVAV